MNNKFYLGRRAKSITVGSRLPPISKVVLKGRNGEFVVGDDSGYTLNVYVPTATEQMAQNIYTATEGFEYQGFVATNAFVPPELELGDGINAKGVYSIAACKEFSFTPKITEDVSAPYTEEDHEYPYTGNYKKELDSKVPYDEDNGGTKISKDKGIEVKQPDGSYKSLADVLSGMGEGGGGEVTAGVITFNGRDGHVKPKREDYLAFIEAEIREAIFESWQAKY